MTVNPFQPPTPNQLGQTPVSPEPNELPIAFYLGFVVAILGTSLLCVQFGIAEGSLFALIAVGPLMLALIPMWRYRGRRSQAVLMLADIAYLSWFTIYMAFNSDFRNTYSPFTVGTVAFPVLLVLCVLAARMQRRDLSSATIPVPVPTGNRLPPNAFLVSVAVVAVGTLLLCIHFGFVQGIFGVTFAFGPLMLAWIPMWLYRSQQSQIVFMFGNLALSCWFLYLYVPLRYPHYMSELDGLITVAIGVTSFPVLLILSIIAGVHHRKDRLSQAGKTNP